MHKNQDGNSSVIAVFCILGLLVIGFYIFSGSRKTSDVAEDLKPKNTLSDFNSSDFAFSYPSTMQSEEASAGTDTDEIFYLRTPDYKPFKPDSYEIEVRILKKDNNLTIDAYQKNVIPNTPEFDFLDKMELKSINGNAVIEKTYKTTLVDGKDASWALYKSYYVYSPDVSVLFKGTSASTDHKLLDDVVSTFKFLK